VLLGRYTQQEDIAVGSLIANRRYAEIENLVGFFVNTLVLRADLSGKPTFREFLKRARDVTLEAYDHQDVPFERVVNAVQPERTLSYNPLFQALFILQSGLGEAMSLGNMNRTALPVENNTAPFDITFDLNEMPTGLRGSLRYNSDLFDRETMEQLIEHFRTLLEGILVQPNACIWDLPLLTEERQQLLATPSVTSPSLSREPDFLELFTKQVQRTPHAIAASVGGETTSYQELDTRANFLARQLASQGVGAERRVAVVDQRGLPLLASLLAIFKVRAAYVPIDPVQPVERLRRLLAESGAQVVLAGIQVQEQVRQVLEHWEQGLAPQIQVLPAWQDLGALDASELMAPVPHQLAYVLFTSGSTGVPKGAMIEQEGMLNHLLCKVKDLGLGQDDRVGQTASQSFDISIWQMLAALLVGGRVQIFRNEESHDPRKLLELMERERLTVVQLVPSMIGAVLEELERLGEKRPDLSHLRWLVPTGEALPPELCRHWLKWYPHIPLLNAYGPTETSDDVTHALIAQPPSEECVHMPIGRAVDNTWLYVLGKYGELLPRGAHGELYVGGKGVGRGYLGDAGKTAEGFLPDPWSGNVGGRLYRTGDLVRYLRDGSLEFLGRRDEQIKLRGYRIELREIEAVIREQEGVREAVVVLREEEGKEKRLVAYVAGEGLSEECLREGIGKRLPEYMVPWAWVMLEKLPLTSNGKVDRKRLPAPERDEQEEGRGYRGPSSVLEEVLVDMWSDLLGIERVGVDENFFTLGGHSLLAIRFLAQVRMLLQVELSLRAIFEAPTIASMAVFMLKAESDGGKRLEETAQMLLSVTHLSDEEVSALLNGEALVEGCDI